MHRGLVCCDPSTSLQTVARIMAAHRIHGVVVRGACCDGERLGVVSDLQLLKAAAAGALERTAAEAVLCDPLLIPADTALEEAMQALAEADATHALVVDRRGAPVGVLSSLDIAEAIAST